MTEQQQYRVIADRDKGDDIRKRFMRGDRVTFGSDADGNTVPVRIERLVPTTDEPNAGPTVTDLASRHCETTTGNHTCADDPSRSPDSPYGATGYCYPCLIRNALTVPSLHPPTREQIAEAERLASQLESNADAHHEGRGTERRRAAAMILALIRNGADR